METRKEKYEIYRNSILESSNLNSLRSRIIEENEKDEPIKIKRNRSNDKEDFYKIYLKKKRIKIITLSLIIILIIVIISLGIYFGVKSI